ncbi:hypothetical protein SAV14893_006230 [Streptomyces avermitilis]|uniref:Uncharacterized protein n=1 Tax=Streptomyces avermitilis TaxID=33903 RepID=A0A4D4LPF8_STRAX|nr:hypothetical protein SAVMC3_18190 [Streptomyces avermitilis]GDY61230.1 hypothetical protein SAV14893_006230 [Streptomyces avermitilis]GDY78687.1 hypothetical protein SAV31267_081720 [Streptomyces avermitilis]
MKHSVSRTHLVGAKAQGFRGDAAAGEWAREVGDGGGRLCHRPAVNAEDALLPECADQSRHGAAGTEGDHDVVHVGQLGAQFLAAFHVSPRPEGT